MEVCGLRAHETFYSPSLGRSGSPCPQMWARHFIAPQHIRPVPARGKKILLVENVTQM